MAFSCTVVKSFLPLQSGNPKKPGMQPVHITPASQGHIPFESHEVEGKVDP